MIWLHPYTVNSVIGSGHVKYMSSRLLDFRLTTGHVLHRPQGHTLGEFLIGVQNSGLVLLWPCIFEITDRQTNGWMPPITLPTEFAIDNKSSFSGRKVGCQNCLQRLTKISTFKRNALDYNFSNLTIFGYYSRVLRHPPTGVGKCKSVHS